MTIINFYIICVACWKSTSNAKRIFITSYFHQLAWIRKSNSPFTFNVIGVCLWPVRRLKWATSSVQYSTTLWRRGSGRWWSARWWSGRWLSGRWWRWCGNISGLKYTLESSTTRAVTRSSMENRHGQIWCHLDNIWPSELTVSSLGRIQFSVPIVEFEIVCITCWKSTCDAKWIFITSYLYQLAWSRNLNSPFTFNVVGVRLWPVWRLKWATSSVQYSTALWRRGSGRWWRWCGDVNRPKCALESSTTRAVTGSSMENRHGQIWSHLDNVWPSELTVSSLGRIQFSMPIVEFEIVCITWWKSTCDAKWIFITSYLHQLAWIRKANSPFTFNVVGVRLWPVWRLKWTTSSV